VNLPQNAHAGMTADIADMRPKGILSPIHPCSNHKIIKALFQIPGTGLHFILS
jgi:hypothetical protein